MTKRKITKRDRKIDRKNGKKAKGSHWKIDFTDAKGHKWHITPTDKKVDSANGKKAKDWNKYKKAKLHKKYNKKHITVHDRKVDRKNGKKSKDWEIN